eukprot:g3129.t1
MLPKTEQEDRLQELFVEFKSQFKEFEKQTNLQKQEAIQKTLTEKIKDAKALIKEFEREARNDQMPAEELSERKSVLVNELNNYISIKKTQTQILNSRLQSSSDSPMRVLQQDEGHSQQGQSSQSTQQIIKTGRKEMKEVEGALGRAEKIVEDTVQIGTQTAAELREQTKQMERVVDDLDDIEFTMKKARKVIADLTRGILTDKFIRLILFLIVIAAVAVIVLTIMKDDEGSSLPKPKEIGVCFQSIRSCEMLTLLYRAMQEN